MSAYSLFTPTPADAAPLAILGARTFRAAWGALYTPEVMQDYLAQAFTPEAVIAQLQDPACRYWALRSDEAIVAYAKAGPLAVPVDDLPAGPCVELRRIYVDDAHKRRGLGRQLLDAFEAHASAHFQAAFICVWSQNAPALALYHEAGFRQVGTCFFPLGDFTNYDIDPDLILRKDYRLP